MKKLLFASTAILWALPAYAQFDDQRTYTPTSGGLANAQTITIPNYNLNVGVVIRFKPTLTNTGASTLSINGKVKNVLKASPFGVIALTGSEIVAGQIAEVIYDGTEFQLVSPLTNVTGVGFISPTSSPYNAACDGVTNDQTAVQNALNAAEAAGTGLVIPGSCVISGLTVNTPIMIFGYGGLSELILASGSSAPAVSIAIPSTAQGVNSGWANVTFTNFRITSPDRDDANKALEHGITFANGSPSVVTAVTLINVDISGIPGDGIHLQGPVSGYFKLIGSKVLLPGQNGLSCNSSTDTIIEGGEFYGAEQYNWLLSTCENVKILASNEFSAQLDGVLLFHSGDTVLTNDTIDTAGQNSINIRNNYNQVTTIQGGLIRWSSSSANNTYYDLFSNADNAGITNLDSVHFQTPASAAVPPRTNIPAGNIGFSNQTAFNGTISGTTLTVNSGTPPAIGQQIFYTGLTGAPAFVVSGSGPYTLNYAPGNVSNLSMSAHSAPINCHNCWFDLGPIGTSGITNASSQLYSGTNQSFTVNTYSQFSGMSGFNGNNFPWKIFCSDAACSIGSIQLFAAGVLEGALNGTGQSTLQSLSLPSTPTSAGSGGLYLCMDTSGVIYKKSSCP